MAQLVDALIMNAVRAVPATPSGDPARALVLGGCAASSARSWGPPSGDRAGRRDGRSRRTCRRRGSPAVRPRAR